MSATRRRSARRSAEGSAGSGSTTILRTCASSSPGTNFVFQGIFLVFVVVARRQGSRAARSGSASRSSARPRSSAPSRRAIVDRLLSMRTIVVAEHVAELDVRRLRLRPEHRTCSLASSVLVSFFIPAGERRDHRLPHRGDARPPDRPGLRASRAASRSAAQPLGPLVGRAPARRLHAALDRARARGGDGAPGALGDAQPVDPHARRASASSAPA